MQVKSFWLPCGCRCAGGKPGGRKSFLTEQAPLPVRSKPSSLTGVRVFPNEGFDLPQRGVSPPPTKQATFVRASRAYQASPRRRRHRLRVGCLFHTKFAKSAKRAGSYSQALSLAPKYPLRTSRTLREINSPRPPCQTTPSPMPTCLIPPGNGQNPYGQRPFWVPIPPPFGYPCLPF